MSGKGTGPSAPWTRRRFIRENVLDSAERVALSPEEYLATVARLSEAGMAGGAVYDALLARAAEKAEATRLLTLNARDFRRVWPPIADIVDLP